uniref:Zinc finger BED domain-containing protein RICESLEEPER 2-like n=1 Tax=Tanacetum cinerariifolium TaxID=118510 RepID=A0A6L2JDW1_TANCI|nr:zinc finger BED domain-containing protein RICESLEEPER 2-like [Tanacetum cinerariifolium]
MTLESNSVNQTPVEVDSSDMEEGEEEEERDEVEQPKGRKKDHLKKNKLRETIRKNIGRVCLTTDGWTSIKKKSYMALTGEWLHIRYVAHIVNLIAQDGIKHVGSSIESIRWNSTYDMLEVAHEYKDAFTGYGLEDVDFGLHIVNKVNELATIRSLLRAQLDCDIHGEKPTDKHLYDIAKAMKPKFEKYYGEVENMNLLVYFAFILDPRNKYEFLDVIVDDHYGREGISVVVKKDYIKGKMKLLYDDYVCIHAPSSTSSSTLGKRPGSTNTSHELDHGDLLRRRMKTGQSSSSSTSELDKYNGEYCEPFDKNVHFDIFLWWKVNSPRFPILSLMARDLLAIPISTVASKSVFSTSGRVLDSYRSSLGDKTIECLVYAQDWLRISLNSEKNEDMDTIAQIKKDY